MHGTEKAQFRDDEAQWWAEWDDPEQQSRKRKAEALQEQHGEARRIWRAQLQELPLQASQSFCGRPCIHCHCGKSMIWLLYLQDFPAQAGIHRLLQLFIRGV